MAWPLIIAGLAGAAASATPSILAATQGNQGPDVESIEQTRTARALQNYMARIAAANVSTLPPTFGEYVASGGKIGFPTQIPGMLPGEAVKLGFVGKSGEAIPYYQQEPGGGFPGELSPEQILFLGAQRLQLRKKGIGPDQLTLPEKLAVTEGKLTRLPGRMSETEAKIAQVEARTDMRPAKQARKLGRLERKLENLGLTQERLVEKKGRLETILQDPTAYAVRTSKPVHESGSFWKTKGARIGVGISSGGVSEKVFKDYYNKP